MDYSAIQKKTGVFLMSSDVPDGFRVSNSLGLVSGSAIYGANFIKDFFARMHDTLGGRIAGYEKAMQGAQRKALEEMAKSAQDLGANAVISIRFESGVVGGTGTVLATFIGTAVELHEV